MSLSEEIIGVDHGFMNMKTAHYIFPTALSLLEGRPDSMEGILEYKDKLYSIDGKKLLAADIHDKTESEEFYLLTLVCLAKELKLRGVRTAKVNLATGLPQKWYLSQKSDFKKYLSRNREIHFLYEGIHYNVMLEKVGVFSQGYPAYVSKANELQLKQKYFVIIDIGGETIDIIPVKSGMIQKEDCRIDTRATIWLLNNIAEKIETETFDSLNEDLLLEYMLSATKDEPKKNIYEQIVQRELSSYCDYVYTKLKEFRINTKITPLVFMGGGSTYIKKFGKYDSDNTYFITDLMANAKGYEIIASHIAR